MDNREPGHFCALVVMRIVGEGVVECLAIDYMKAGGRMQVKWPGGTSKNKEVPFRDMVATLRREVREEVGEEVEINLTDDVLNGRRVILKKELSPTHIQYFFFVSDDDISGNIRKIPKYDDDELLSPPYWIEAEKLSEKIFRSHRPALMEALDFICRSVESSRIRYFRLLKAAV